MAASGYEMRCYHPLTGYRALKGGITWNPKEAYVDQNLTVACGQCVGCRLKRSKEWAIRMMHEAQEHPASCFLTLTYSDKHLPPMGSLVKTEFPLFMKRLRRKMSWRETNPKTGRLRRVYPYLKYFHCGEYGEVSGRPHYHAALFGTDFPDRYLWATRNGHSAYRSPLLESCWKLGNAEIGELTFESAAYIARYITKKVNGSKAEAHYTCMHIETGELVEYQPEFATMSRRPGIGRRWLEKYSDDVYPADEVIMRGSAMKPPRYYDLFYQEQDPEGYEQLALERRLSRDKENSTPERLEVLETCAEARLSLYSPRKGVE